LHRLRINIAPEATRLPPTSSTSIAGADRSTITGAGADIWIEPTAR
jgi:hypothetical protein